MYWCDFISQDIPKLPLESQLQCNLCDESFASVGALKMHTVLIHNNNLQHKIEVKPEIVQEVNQTPKCDECGQEVRTQAGLRKHKQLCHSAKKKGMMYCTLLYMYSSIVISRTSAPCQRYYLRSRHTSFYSGWLPGRFRCLTSFKNEIIEIGYLWENVQLRYPRT